MADTEYVFVNADGTKITTRDAAAAAHMRYDLGFEEQKSSSATKTAPVAETTDAKKS